MEKERRTKALVVVVLLIVVAGLTVAFAALSTTLNINGTAYLDAARKDLFPVGRLDKDTEGLLLITNDGALAHELLSPKKHVAKTYYARIEGKVTAEDVAAFFDENGLGAIINSSRGITAAYKKDTSFTEEEYAKAAREAALRMKEQLNEALRNKNNI